MTRTRPERSEWPSADELVGIVLSFIFAIAFVMLAIATWRNGGVW